MLPLWAEMDLAVGDEFRDGDVPATTKALLPVAQRAFQALPDAVNEFYSAVILAVGSGRW